MNEVEFPKDIYNKMWSDMSYLIVKEPKKHYLIFELDSFVTEYFFVSINIYRVVWSQIF